MYLFQPPGLSDGNNSMWKLYKALYCLRRGACAWHLRDVRKSRNQSSIVRIVQADSASFVKVGPKFRTFLFTHVDDHSVVRTKCHRVDVHKILQRFEGNMSGEVKFFLGMNVARD
jgi:hypothetical protein